MGDGAADLVGLEVCLVDTLLAVLEIEPEVVHVEFRVVILLDFLDVFNLSQGAQIARAEEFVFRVVEQIDATERVRRDVYHADGEELAVDPVLHMVAAAILGPDTFVLSLAKIVMDNVAVYFLCGEGLVFVKERDLAQESFILLFIQILRVLMDSLLILDIDFERFLCKHGARDLNCIFVFRLRIKGQRTMLVEILEVSRLLNDFFFSLLHFLLLLFDWSLIDDCQIAGLLYLEFETRTQGFFEMVVNSLEERILVLFGLQLEEGRDGDISAPAFGLLKSLVAARDHADAF